MDGVIACTQKEFGFEIFNLGESQTVKLSRLIELIEAALGKKAVIDRQPMQPGDVPITFADISKARDRLGYHPQIKIEQGIKLFAEWFQKQSQLSPDMESDTKFTRPTLTEALDAWQQLLAERGFATNLAWIFEENLCIETAARRARAVSASVSRPNSRRRPMTRWTSRSTIFPRPARGWFFTGSAKSPGKSVCILLCDPWFEDKGDADGYCPPRRMENVLSSRPRGQH